MTFYNLIFIGFFVCLLCLLSVSRIPAFRNKLDKKNSLKLNHAILLGASYLFLGLSDWLFCLLLLLLTLVTYFCAIGIEKKNQPKLFMLIGVICPLVMLGVFKYANFFLSSFEKVFGKEDLVTLNLILPLGISFFTFSAISYVVDVYRKKHSASNDFVKVALYISFFPKLIAGPIMRASEFLPQLDEDRTVSFKNIEVGLQIFIFGLFKKVVLADHLAVFVNEVFATPVAFSSQTVVLAAVSYSLQIYFDFSGYTDMAIGIAKSLGYDLCKNFNLPYISRNVTEFWKRWHISLSSWLQDYLYIPLGGNRKGEIRTYLNLLLTMILGGLWHGANWTFILWGGMHGLGLCIHKVFMKWRKDKIYKPSLLIKIMSILFTFIFVTICWVFFRAPDIQTAFTITGVRQLIGTFESKRKKEAHNIGILL